MDGSREKKKGGECKETFEVTPHSPPGVVC